MKYDVHTWKSVGDRCQKTPQRLKWWHSEDRSEESTERTLEESQSTFERRADVDLPVILLYIEFGQIYIFFIIKQVVL